MNTIGRHLIAEFYGCSAETLDDEERVKTAMLQAATAVGVTVLGEIFHRYAPQGVSGTVLIAESHLSVHTWPEAGYAAVDIYTCGGLDPRPGFEVLGVGLAATSSRVQEIVRGIPKELERGVAFTAEDVQIMSEVVRETRFDNDHDHDHDHDHEG